MESYFVKWFMHLTSKDFFHVSFSSFLLMEKRYVVYYIDISEFLDDSGKFMNVKCVIILYDLIILLSKIWIFSNFKRDLIQLQIKKQILNIRKQKITKFTWTKGLNLSSVNEKTTKITELLKQSPTNIARSIKKW